MITCRQGIIAFENEREAAIFMLGYNTGAQSDSVLSSAVIDHEETQTVLLNMTEDEEATFTLEAIKVNNMAVAQPAQHIAIHIEGGLVQAVVSEHPLNYIVVDSDIEGSLEDDICDTPPELSKALNFDGEGIAKPRCSHPAFVSPHAVTELVQLHEKVSQE